MKTKKKNVIDQLLDTITPIEQAKTDAKMLLAAKIADAIKDKGWKNKDLLKALNKDNPSIITKWLSGTHNFTVETLVELENALDVKLLNLLDRKEATVSRYHFIATGQPIGSMPLRSINNLFLGEPVSNAYLNYRTGNHD